MADKKNNATSPAPSGACGCSESDAPRHKLMAMGQKLSGNTGGPKPGK